jgi:hypothetical protein
MNEHTDHEHNQIRPVLYSQTGPQTQTQSHTTSGATGTQTQTRQTIRVKTK